jgi:hypothetical protein
MVIRARRDDDALRAQDRVAAIGLQARAVFAIGEGERERPRRRGKFSAETVRPEAVPGKSGRRR